MWWMCTASTVFFATLLRIFCRIIAQASRINPLNTPRTQLHVSAPPTLLRSNACTFTYPRLVAVLGTHFNVRGGCATVRGVEQSRLTALEMLAQVPTLGVCLPTSTTRTTHVPCRVACRAVSPLLVRSAANHAPPHLQRSWCSNFIWRGECEHTCPLAAAYWRKYPPTRPPQHALACTGAHVTAHANVALYTTCVGTVRHARVWKVGNIVLVLVNRNS